jgi:hypothetical protein
MFTAEIPKSQTLRCVSKLVKEKGGPTTAVPSGWCIAGRTSKQFLRARKNGEWVRAVWNARDKGSQFGWVRPVFVEWLAFGDLDAATPSREGFSQLTLPQFKKLQCFEICGEESKLFRIVFDFCILGPPANPYPPPARSPVIMTTQAGEPTLLDTETYASFMPALLAHRIRARRRKAARRRKQRQRTNVD